MKIVRMAQGSPEWHLHRRRYRNASETPAVLGVSPWLTPYQLWQLKLGLKEQAVTPAMKRGTELEPVARAAYERQTGRVMRPLVVVDKEYSASLDGVALRGDRILEVKCPMKGRDSELWETVAAGRLPEHYRWQVEHQLMVTAAEVADVYVASRGIYLPASQNVEAAALGGLDPGRRYVAEILRVHRDCTCLGCIRRCNCAIEGIPHRLAPRRQPSIQRTEQW